MRTLNDIVPPSRRVGADLPGTPSIPSREPLRLVERPPRFPYRTLVAALVIIILSVAVLAYFSSSTVTITPRTISATVQSSFVASQNGTNVPFQIITAQKVATQSVAGSGSKTVNTSASGNITIYNTQTKAQKLITNTRFATTAGLIFRIHTAVTIPGGTPAKPGSIVAKVYADQAGISYNVGPTAFTIPGFAGTPQASQVYARSTSAIAGGASGTVPVVDAAVEAQTRSALTSALKPDLDASIEAEVPPGYVLLPGAATTTYEALAASPSATTGMVDIKEQATVTAAVFPNAALAKAIALSVAEPNYQGEPLTLASPSDLKLSATSIPDEGASSFSFTLAGTAPLVYTVDPSRIAAVVSGKDKSAAYVALSSYPEVERAIITLRPIWRSTFPQDPSSISIVVVEGEN